MTQLLRTILLVLAAVVMTAPSVTLAKGELVLVAGATGRTGKQAVLQLAARGYRVRALVRDEGKATKAEFPAGVAVVKGDVRDIESLKAGMKGVKFVISAIGAGGGPNPTPGNGAEDIDNQGVANLAQAARAARVRHMVLVSSAATTHYADYPVPFMRPILAAKFKGEAALRASGVPYTIVRPGGLLDEAGGKVAVEFMQGDTANGRIPRADVATVCIEALGRKSALGKTLEIVSGKAAWPNNWDKDFAALAADPKP
jgi:uncharacterized protein YbjT (DUF2867 family)